MSNASKGIVLGKAKNDGFNLYETGIAPSMGINFSEVKPKGILFDHSYDEIQGMANPNDIGEGMMSGASAIQGLLGDGQDYEQPALPPAWHPTTTPLKKILLPYAASIWDTTPITEVLQQNGGRVVNRKPKIYGEYSQGE